MISCGDKDYICLRAKVLSFKANPGGALSIESFERPTCVHFLPSGVVQNFDDSGFEVRLQQDIYVLKEYYDRHNLERKFV